MFQLSMLSKFKEVIHGFSNISNGNQAFRILGEYQPTEEVKKNREKFLKELKLSPKNGIAMHTGISQARPKITLADATFKGKGMNSPEDAIKTEALIANTNGIFFFLTIADCYPILLYDPITHSFGIAHGSRDMIAQNLPKKIVEQMQKMFRVKPENLYIGIGPGIKKESYILQYLDPKFHVLQFKMFTKQISDGSIRVDLPSAIGFLFQDAGVKKENIEISIIDTAASSDYFSHYRDSRKGIKEGRFASVFGLR